MPGKARIPLSVLLAPTNFTVTAGLSMRTLSKKKTWTTCDDQFQHHIEDHGLIFREEYQARGVGCREALETEQDIINQRCRKSSRRKQLKKNTLA
ncbi:hypothetical protein D910_10223 [Dendroctonus ponderosae]|uniref:Uncharacterized protein n=1 Tax=Dendroctonus ponderosae TaxID=77166 RepID=U4UKC6_DENPD|nr:hypothetical protein D910_10223 [Dendroctonus ponderosae]